MSQLMQKTCAATAPEMQLVINYNNEEHCEFHQVHSINISCIYMPRNDANYLQLWTV